MRINNIFCKNDTFIMINTKDCEAGNICNKLKALVDVWMTCDFTSLLIVFQSYRVDVWMIMKGCVQWNSVYGWEDFTSSEDWTPSARSVSQHLTHWATGVPRSPGGSVSWVLACWSSNSGFYFCWRLKSFLLSVGFHCTQPSIITLPSNPVTKNSAEGYIVPQKEHCVKDI